jgi:hypothetical protein
VSSEFEALFRADPGTARAKFLSRVFGIFSEEIVRIWAGDARAPYEEVEPGGRPTLKAAGATRGHTLDFLLRDRSTHQVFVVEMKCEIEYQDFRYFVLEKPEQLEHHTKDAFRAFLAAAGAGSRPSATVRGQEVAYDGAILIWGAVSEEGRQAVRAQTGLRDVLSMEAICADLATWRDPHYAQLLQDRLRWSREMFEGLCGLGPS